MIKHPDFFEQRHNSNTEVDVQSMVKAVGYSSIDELINATIPAHIRLPKEMQLPEALSERELVQHMNALGEKNEAFTSCIGQGYYESILPEAIKRNVLENPAWYTAYTPYQAEIAQGRLEALINFQTMITDLCGMELANASLLDEATAAAEAMIMLFNANKKKVATKFFVADTCFAQTVDVLQTRAESLGIELVIGSLDKADFTGADFFGAILQYPDSHGAIINPADFIASAHVHDVQVVVATDLLSLTLLTPPGEMGADVVIGSTQRFGLPLGYGGPHAAFFATREKYKRQIPGRIIGLSKDKFGNKAYRMALQTREQHIKREKATSNICTAQVLPAVIASFYAVYHGPVQLKAIASYVHNYASFLSEGITSLGLKQTNQYFFDTLRIEIKDGKKLRKLAEAKGINFFYTKEYVQVAVGETITQEIAEDILSVFEEYVGKKTPKKESISALPKGLTRSSDFMKDAVFHSYHSEHGLLRYIKQLESKDLSLVHSMISLGSCTMKLNAATEMVHLSNGNWANIHPFAPKSQTQGYQTMLDQLSDWLCEITGFDGMSLQPNSGAQGEYAGLLTIMNYLQAKGEGHRNIVLIPSSAHGTNPASAIMAGMKVVLVLCDEKGNIDIADLKEKAEANKEHLAALMVTYPSTHGVFEEGIQEICSTIHEFGGQVYMDGANMNAQVGLTSPAMIGADVCHLNLHKTFCIPHGGGGPGMGPIGVGKHLIPHLPGHIYKEEANGAMAAAPFSSALILTISYAYIAMMGSKGLTKATKHAILNANYIKKRVENDYPILYGGKNGTCAHEFIIDCRELKSVGIQVDDIAKRLMDYGFHAPTVSFPVGGTMMIEPTESESKAELDRFCEAMINIKQEINEVAKGDFSAQDNVLVNAPHTAKQVVGSLWKYPYSREKAAFPLGWVEATKFWPSVSRIDNAYGDRNLVCTCGEVEDYV
ncbi:MAG: aminomethyl-transferring glycine dehydrogenase [Cyclobacteriaceae bacterium]